MSHLEMGTSHPPGTLDLANSDLDLVTRFHQSTLPSHLSNSTDPSISYDGSELIYRLLRLETWGSPLMNLGYFVFPWPLSPLNLLFPVEQAQRRLVLKTERLLEIQPGDRVLDLACGRGQSSFILQNLHPQSTVVGLDLVERHVGVAQTLFGKTRNLSFAEGNAMLLADRDDSFDRIMCLEAAFHFPDRQQFLQESFRVLRPGGRLVVVDFAWTTDEDRVHRNDPETLLVRQAWQWDDFSSVDEYATMARRSGFHVSARRDWSGHVTQPMQLQLQLLYLLSRSKLGRRILCWKNPLFRSFSTDDWNACTSTVAAHQHVMSHSRYMAFVFDKPPIERITGEMFNHRSNASAASAE
jgi:MPBQ/MSBQ methyltransferase